MVIMQYTPSLQHRSSDSKRPPFTPAQLLQAEYIGKIHPIKRNGRKEVKTHPIDNVEPHIVADRDDGILVDMEKNRLGGYRIYITIADVAAHVKLDSPLGKSALSRGFTEYRPWGNDPMFPSNIEEKMSLEHKKERLGFTVAIDLDKNYHPTHSEFYPTITHAEGMSYAQAAERLSSDPVLQRMNQVAGKIRKHYFAGTALENLLADGFSGRSVTTSSSENWVKATDMVATYMLLANQTMAKFFDDCNWPYVYRNFNNAKSEEGAKYSPVFTGHDGISGQVGNNYPYGHFTSPIRRAADFINAHIAHAAHTAITDLENSIKKSLPAIDADALHVKLWKNAATLLRACGNHANPKDAVTTKNTAKNKLQNILIEIGAGKIGSSNAARKGIDTLMLHHPPLTVKELKNATENINLLTKSPEQKHIRKITQYQYALGKLTKDGLNNLQNNEFSALLTKAAALGEMPRILFNETVERIRSNKINLHKDGYTLLMNAPYSHIPRWNRLKREILRHVKLNHEAITGIFDSIKQNFQGNIEIAVSNLPNLEEEPSVVTALVTIKEKDTDTAYTTPYYSVGHDNRSAASHAKYAFIEHAAFGELHPLEQASLPNLLYAELDNAKRSKSEVIHEMVKQAGGSIEESKQKISPDNYVKCDQYLHQVKVSGGFFPEEITAYGKGHSTEEAERRAYRYLLRDERFKRAVAPPLTMQPVIANPQQILEEIAANSGCKWHFSQPTESKNSKTGRFSIVLTLIDSEGRTQNYSGSGPNKDRAIRTAITKGIRELGIDLKELYSPKTIGSGSWSNTVTRKLTDTRSQSEINL